MNQTTSPLFHKKVAFHTLGCKLNFAETSSLQDALCREGALIAARDEQADICIINTCSVTDVADAKCRQTIHKFIRNHPNAFVVVIGCYAQLQPNKIAQFEGVDLVIGTEHKGEIIPLIKQNWDEKQKLSKGEACHKAIAIPTKDINTFVPSCSKGNRTRYFLKVQDGCNYYCTYCTIPYARGKSRNGSIHDIVLQAEEVVKNGGKEIVLTGVNTGDFGRSTGETFFDLIQKLDQVEGIERYRISSIEPNLLTEEIIAFCAQSKKFMPHFHIPLQSGSDEVLKLMKRRYSTTLFAEKINCIKQYIPDAFIGVDVIVGMRGETDEYFEKAYQFIEGLDISQLHVFSYSERPGTKALEIPHVVNQNTKHERSQRLLELSERKRKLHYKKFQGERRPVLWENAKEGIPLSGFTDNYIRVVATDNIPATDNTISIVQLGNFSTDEETLIAQL